MSSATDQLDNKTRELNDLAQHAIQYAKSSGAQNVKVATGATSERRLTVEAKEFTLANSLDNLSIGVGVHVDGRKGSASVNG